MRHKYQPRISWDDRHYPRGCTSRSFTWKEENTLNALGSYCVSWFCIWRHTHTHTPLQLNKFLLFPLIKLCVYTLILIIDSVVLWWLSHVRAPGLFKNKDIRSALQAKKMCFCQHGWLLSAEKNMIIWQNGNNKSRSHMGSERYKQDESYECWRVWLRRG